MPLVAAPQSHQQINSPENGLRTHVSRIAFTLLSPLSHTMGPWHTVNKRSAYPLPLLSPSLPTGTLHVQADGCQLPEGPSRVRHRSDGQSGGAPGCYQRCPGGLHWTSIEPHKRKRRRETDKEGEKEGGREGVLIRGRVCDVLPVGCSLPLVFPTLQVLGIFL